jgi:magnesium-protoporphyrin IX monomethyl ester (oxidative) cyclase
MRILLINPPLFVPKEIGLQSLDVEIPLGILNIASVIQKNYYFVRILDCIGHEKVNIKKVKNYVRLGLSWEEIRKYIKKFNPDIVGISYKPAQFYSVTKTAKIVKEILPNTVVVIGGIGPTIKPKDFLNEHVDFIVRGEGERAFLELVNAIFHKKDYEKISGLFFYDQKSNLIDNGIVHIDNLNALPFPAYHLINMENYFKLYKKLPSRYSLKKRVVSIITSRGCPFDCFFCSVHLINGYIWRAYDTKYLIEQIKYLKYNYKIKNMHFEDDNLTLNKKRFQILLDELIKERLKINWDTPNGVRLDFLDEIIIKKAKLAGCKALTIAPESGSQRVIDEIINKKLKIKDAVKIAKLCKKFGIFLYVYFVVGLPGEKKEDIRKTLEFAYYIHKKYNIIPIIFLANPFYGTKLYEICKKNNFLVREPESDDIIKGSHPRYGGLIRTKDFNPEYLKKEISNFYKKIIFLQFTKPIFLLRIILFSPSDFIRKLKKLLNFSSL